VDIFEFIGKLANPEMIIHYGGLALLLITIFAENGLIIGFFLPGDSLLFISGLICASQPELLGLPIELLMFYLFISAVAGCTFGYWFGRHFGKKTLERKENWLFKRKYVDMTSDFYQRHGGKTLILGRYLPIIRTFAPILAGVIKVEFKSFMFYNIIGGAMWIGTITSAGYFLGQFEIVKNNIDWIILGFVIVTTAILTNTYLIQQRRKKKQLEKES
jgi:membrane-associated protein